MVEAGKIVSYTLYAILLATLVPTLIAPLPILFKLLAIVFVASMLLLVKKIFSDTGSGVWTLFGATLASGLGHHAHFMLEGAACSDLSCDTSSYIWTQYHILLVVQDTWAFILALVMFIIFVGLFTELPIVSRLAMRLSEIALPAAIAIIIFFFALYPMSAIYVPCTCNGANGLKISVENFAQHGPILWRLLFGKIGKALPGMGG